MGKGRDKRKKVKDKQKAKELAIERNEKLKAKDGGAVDDVLEEEDKKKKKLSEAKELEAIIEEIRKKDQRRQHVGIGKCGPPSPRLNFSLSLINGNEAILFGGEFYDGNPINTHVFNELYKWNLATNEWTKIESINSPPPRCSHQRSVPSVVHRFFRPTLTFLCC